MLFVFLCGVICLPAALVGLYLPIRTVAKWMYNQLEHAPPWNDNKIVSIYFPRHYRKHGRVKLTPRYPDIYLRHLKMMLMLLLYGSTPSTISQSTEMRLRHTPWAPDCQESSSPVLEYYDISFNGSWDPSDIMKPFRKPPEKYDGWGSPSAPPFELSSVNHDMLFSDDYDPSQIVKILQFEVKKKRKLKRSEASVYFNIVDNPSCYSSITENKSTPQLIVDSGASTSITPLRSDFITYRECSSMSVRGLTSSNTVDGEGLIKWDVVGTEGQPVSLIVEGCHIPSAGVRLLSPQKLFRKDGGYSYQTANKLKLTLGDGNALDANYCPRTNLPCLQLVDDVSSTLSLLVSFWTQTFFFDKNTTSAFPTILSEGNTNISAGQKEVSLIHQRLSHASFKWIKPLMRDRKWLRDKSSDESFRSGSFLPCSHQASTCDVRELKCIACTCAKAHRRSPRVRKQVHKSSDAHLTVNSEPCRSLKQGHTVPGACISADHYLSPVEGRLYNTMGRERKGYTCGTLFVDHASGKIFNFPQFSTTANETVESKHSLERLALEEGMKIKSYHADNGVFAADAFKRDCTVQTQSLTFSGVGAHHQNGVAERNIKTISQWARTNMLHAALHWPEHATIRVWPQAVDYAIWVFNRLPSSSTGLSPNEIWSQSRDYSHDLQRSHVFGCPVYVLDPTLQDGGKIPKWNTRARRGMFVGFSKQHSSLVALVLNIQTGKISPQYHVIFDDKFETVASLPKGDNLRDEWMDILRFQHDCYLDIDADPDIPTSLLPIEFVDWFKGNDDLQPIDDVSKHQTAPTILEYDDSIELVDNPVFDNATEGEILPSEVLNDVTEGVDDETAGTASEGATKRPSRNVGTWKDGPAIIRKFPINGEEYEFNFNAEHISDQPAVMIASRPIHSSQPLPQKISKSSLLECYLLQTPWEYDRQCFEHLQMDTFETRHVDNISDPRVLESYVLSPKTSKYNEDNPSFDMAMKGPFQAEYWEAMRLELNTIAGDFKCWELVPRQPHMNVLPSTWAFKVKRYPDGSVKKFKARFCARGDRQLEGVDYFETWAPVVQWSTIRIVMIIAAKLRYCSAQCDITAAFIHALLPPEEVVYVEQPRGFSKTDNHVLRLNRSLYGLKQAPRHFFRYLSDRIAKYGLQQSQYDPCLFISSNMMVIVYVDDLLIFAKSDNLIEDFITSMQREEICLRREGTAEGYLGVDIQHINGKIHLTQSGLSQRIITAMGLTKYSNSCPTPAEVSPLPKDIDGDKASGTINYASIVGMLLYLCGHSRPDLTFAVHQCARYTFAPTKQHEKALLRIGHYLKGTMDKGLILSPSEDLYLDCYPDADFAGLWKTENPDDPHCVRSRTGFVITLANCPIIWSSKMQTEIALSTMEAEYIALNTACRDLFPVMDKLAEITTLLNLPFKSSSNMHVRIHEDNVGALTLGKLEPRRMTPRSKHYAVKYHWFREQLLPRNIELVKIATENQLGDIFTKGLSSIAFRRVRKQLMGW